MTEGNETFGQRLARLRKKAGITQEKLAEMLDVSYMTVRRWEWGKNAPRLDEAKKIAAALDVNDEELFYGTAEQESNETFGQRLRRLRKAKGFTQAELAYQINVHEMTIRRWESGERVIQNINDIKNLAAALNVSEEELLNGAPEQGGWVLQIKIATEFKEEIIDMRAKVLPSISNLTCTPQGACLTLSANYDLWGDIKQFKAFIKQLEQGRNLVLQNGKALGGIKEEK